MMKSKKPGCYFRIALLAVVSSCSVALVHAEDIVPGVEQSDEQVSVWAKDASLELFVSQLAGMTGRRTAIASGLEGRVSGRFNGSMVDTLNTVSEQHQMLFDLDKNVLGVVAESARENAKVPLTGSSIDDVLQGSLSSVRLRGNEIELHEDAVVVSGHPEFVKRVAKLVATSVADARPDSDPPKATDEPALVDPVAEVLADAATEASADSLSALPSESETYIESEQVTDAAASVMLEQAEEESLAGDVSDTTASSPRAIRWVTDIPGFDTF